MPSVPTPKLTSEEYLKLERVRSDLQDKILVERFTRQTESTWEYWSANTSDSKLELKSIDVQIGVDEIYSKVEFKPEPPDDDDQLKEVEKNTAYR